MIKIVDEGEFIKKEGRLIDPEKDPIHYLHFMDLRPICWTMNQEGGYQGSYEDGEVTCSECLAFISEED